MTTENLLGRQIELAKLDYWQETDLIESDNGQGVVFYYKVEQRNGDFVLIIRTNQYAYPDTNRIEIFKFIHSIEEVYKIVDAIKNFVDVLK